MIKQSVVSGSFYPSEQNDLQSILDDLFSSLDSKKSSGKPRAMIAPHAGLIFSGQNAAHIYSVVKGLNYTRAIIVAPSHRHTHIDFFIGDYQGYETPLGKLKTDRVTIDKLLTTTDFIYDERVDAREHSLEMQLPFIKYLFPEIGIVPIIFCKQNLPNAIKLKDHLVDLLDDDTLLIISTDLSHFHSARNAEKIDGNLIEMLLSNDIEMMNKSLVNRDCEACGFGGILTFMLIREHLGSSVGLVHLCYSHSGEMNGDYKSVVGYMSCALV
jgi:hypothetical protein